MSFLSTAVQTILEQGSFCAVATSAPTGPHCTPLVFAYSGGRLWFTTSRRAVKTRAWKADPAAAGLVRHGELAVAFTGSAKLYDALDRNTWGGAVAGATSIARATAAYSRKNARFFAGYAVDAKQVPFAWTPPGRVFVGIELARTALLDADGVQEGKGRWAGASTSHATFRRSTKGDDPLSVLPPEVREPLGAEGVGALTLIGERGPVVVPVRWRADEHAIYAALPAETLALAVAGPEAPAALTVDAGVRVARARHGGRDGAGNGVDLRPRFPRERREDGPRARDGDRPRRRWARAARADARGVVARLVERERRRHMSTAEFSVEIDASPERVWEVVSNPANIPHWERHVESVQVPDELEEDSTYSVVMSFMGVRVRVRGEILRWEPPSHATIHLRGPLDALIETSIARLPHDRSLLRHEVTYQFRGPLGGLVAAGLTAVGGAQLGIKVGTLGQKRQIEGR